MAQTTRIAVTLRGCDDHTTVQMDVTDDQLALLRELESRVTDASLSSCMPTLALDERARGTDAAGNTIAYTSG